MTKTKLNLVVMGLGLLFLNLHFVSGRFVENHGIVEPLPVLAAALLAGAPVGLALFLIRRSYRGLERDEYLQRIELHRMLIASLSTILFMTVVGFYDEHAGGEYGLQGYAKYVFWWMLMWVAGGFGQTRQR
jgi:hypothetical protein